MFEILIAEGAVPLLELVLNHASFAQTVENLFTCSFLVRPCTAHQWGMFVSVLLVAVRCSPLQSDHRLGPS
jgi:Nse4 C-terminal